MHSVCFGIDLGTTNSCISMLQPNSIVPEIIPLADGKTIPSCVMLNEDGTLTVGKEAYEHRYEDSTIYSVKRFMGQDKIITLKNGNAVKEMTPVEVSSEILKAIVSQASAYVGEGIIKDVTITVPAHFNDAQRRATRKAGQLAGLNVISIINEPTSAGLLYGIDTAKSNETILVYDLGGGTFDVSILRVTKELRSFPMLGININGEYNKTAINIIGNQGDVALGGDDIDFNMVNYILDQLSNLTGEEVNDILDVLGDEGTEKLKLLVEQNKKSKMSTVKYVYKEKEYVLKTLCEESKELVYRPIFNRTYELVSKALAESGTSRVDKIVLVGGSTKSKYIREMIAEKFPYINIMNSFEPDLSVALGASISSSSVLGMSRIATITDVVPMSIGSAYYTSEGTLHYDKILKKDSQLPCISSMLYSIINPDEPVTISIAQSDNNYIDESEFIGTISVEPKYFKGDKFCRVNFKCDLNGVLAVAIEVGGEEFPIDIKYSANDASEDLSKDSFDMTKLDKGLRFFYESHKNKLKKMGAPRDIISKWKPEVMLEGLEHAKEVFAELEKSL